MFRVVICLTAILSAWPAAGADLAATARARSIAAEAYATILDHPFEGAVIEKASNQLEQAEKLNANEPLIWVGVAQLILTRGFSSGDFFDARYYEERAINEALSFASKAVQLDSANAESHAMMAKLYIITRKYDDAKHELAVAHKLDPDAFKPWLYQAVVLWKTGNARLSLTALTAAEEHAHSDWDRRQALYQRETVAKSRGDEIEHERLHKALIALDPGRPWPHGNFGWFLLKHRRYDESISEFEKAIKFGSYPNALQGLEEAKRARAAAQSAGRQ
jgi:Tfp pilus assembly protein PilF